MKQLLNNLLDKLLDYKGCDSCGMTNPPVTKDGNRRVTLCCITKGGFYHTSEMPKGYGSNGKTITYRYRLPIKFKWIGFTGYKTKY